MTVSDPGAGQQQGPQVKHFNRSEPGNGLCSCGAKPIAGQHIPTWWRQHALGAAPSPTSPARDSHDEHQEVAPCPALIKSTKPTANGLLARSASAVTRQEDTSSAAPTLPAGTTGAPEKAPLPNRNSTWSALASDYDSPSPARDEARDAASAPGESCPTCVSAGGPYRCCPHCADDPIAHEGGQRNHHDLPCTLCIESPGVQGGREEAREAVARVLIKGLVTYAEAFASGWDNCPDIDWREAATIFVNDCEVVNELLALPELEKLLRRPA